MELKYERTCFKVRFHSRKAAKHRMKEINLKPDMHIDDVYFCKECDSWHLTSMDKKRSRDYTKKLNNGIQ